MSINELSEWCKDGWFRIHDFQRKWILKNYKLIDDEDKWQTFTYLINDCIPKKLTPQAKRKIRIGRNGKGFAYIVKVRSKTFKVNFQLQFTRKSLIVSLPRNESIYISWNEFNEDLEHKIVQEIRNIVSRAITIYNEVFKQQVLAYDDGWIGKKKPLRPDFDRQKIKILSQNPEKECKKNMEIVGRAKGDVNLIVFQWNEETYPDEKELELLLELQFKPPYILSPPIPKRIQS